MLEGIAYDKPNKHSRQFLIKTPIWRVAVGDLWDLNRTPVAPPWRRDRSLEKDAKIGRRPFWASSDERVVSLLLPLPTIHSFGQSSIMEPPSALPAHSHKQNRTRFNNSDENWEMQREAIRHLYISLNHPLKKVMAIMRDTYGFQAG